MAKFILPLHSNEISEQPVVVYDYQSGRSRAYAEDFLTGYKGYLQCDGYSVYDNIEGIIPIGCWAHSRRKEEKRNKGRANLSCMLAKVTTASINK